MLIFLDLETTGLESDDKICSIAILVLDDEVRSYKYELINEGKKIPPEASSIHHITSEMIKESPAFKDSEIYEFLKLNNNENSTIIAHNVKFDLQMLSSAGLIWRGDIIDTLRVTRHLVPECEFFSLQILRYELKLYRDEAKENSLYGIKDAMNAHNALSDALVSKLLFDYLLEISSEDKMKELSFEHVLVQKFNFGKHKGKYIEEVAMNDRGYLEWLLGSVTDLDEDLRYSIHHYLEG